MAERSKSKAVRTRLIDPKREREPYKVLNQVIESHRDDLRGARIALYWHDGWIADADGNLIHTKTIVRGDAERQLAAYDLGIEINREVWSAAPADGTVRHAMLYHALCRVQQKVDADGEPKSNELDQPVYRRRREDIREFSDVVAVFGPYHERLDEFVSAAKRSESRPASQPPARPAAGSGRRGRNRAKPADPAV